MMNSKELWVYLTGLNCKPGVKLNLNRIRFIFSHIKPIAAFVFFVALLFPLNDKIHAQENNTSSDTVSVYRHNPNKAVVYSLICPGLGQVYNKKYWKLPVIYGAGGTLAYFLAYNQLKYKKFRDAYETGTEGSQAYIDGMYYDYDILPRGRDFYRRYRDLSVLGLGALYLLNVIDAMVDAYFFSYDITDDLSMRVEPAMIESYGMTSGLGLRINLGF
jgi:hypothetical protein